jgi:hypothetical protein
VLRRAIWIGYLLAGLAGVSAVPLQGQADRPALDLVILKADDVTPASVRLTIIIVDTKADSESVRRKLQSGASFESLAREYSTHPSAVDGGEFGVFSVADLRPEFRAALTAVQSGGYTQAITIQKPTVPPGWPDGLPLPGASLKDVELRLGRSYSASTRPADAGSSMTELTYPFGVRLRIHESRGLGFMEFTPPWKSSIFGIRPDDQLPSAVLDALPRTGRFIRGVFASVPGHPNWFIDVDDRVDAVSRMLFVDRNIYGNLPGIPKAP